MRNVSRNFMLITNIHNADLAHKKTDCGPECNVSLTQLKMAADELAKAITIEEFEQVRLMEWPF